MVYSGGLSKGVNVEPGVTMFSLYTSRPSTCSVNLCSRGHACCTTDPPRLYLLTYPCPYHVRVIEVNSSCLGPISCFTAIMSVVVRS